MVGLLLKPCKEAFGCVWHNLIVLTQSVGVWKRPVVAAMLHLNGDLMTTNGA